MISQISILIILSALINVKGQKLHESMTEAEIQSVFNRNLDTMHELEYEVVQLLHYDKNSIQRSSPTIQMKAFNQNYTLYIEENSNVLMGDKTPILLAKKNSILDKTTTKPPIRYTRSRLPLPKNFKLYHDVKNLAAVTVHTDSNNKVHVNGVVGNNLVIRSLPPRIHNFIANNSFENFSAIESSDVEGDILVSTPTITHHVVMKTMDNDFENYKDFEYMDERNYNTGNQFESVPLLNRRFLPKARSSSISIPSTVYVQILVVIDFNTYQIHKKNLETLTSYMLAFWNAVDLRFREINEPKIRLNIAGFIVPEETMSDAVYMNSNVINPKTILSHNTLVNLGKFFSKKNFSQIDYDVVIGVSSRALGSYKNNTISVTETGRSFVGGACKTAQGYAVGIINHNGGFKFITTAAHELGHLLGSPHDGKESAKIPGGPCDWNEGYLMSYKRNNERSQHWSKCSIRAMKDFIKSGKAECLKNKPDVGRSFPKILPGRLMSRDEQCKKSMGLLSSKKYESNCVLLWCKDPQKSTSYSHSKPPAEGSYCGKDKICLNARCVRDPEL